MLSQWNLPRESYNTQTSLLSHDYIRFVFLSFCFRWRVEMQELYTALKKICEKKNKVNNREMSTQWCGSKNNNIESNLCNSVVFRFAFGSKKRTTIMLKICFFYCFILSAHCIGDFFYFICVYDTMKTREKTKHCENWWKLLV